MNAILQFKNYHVIETFYKYNPVFDVEEGEANLSPEIEFNLDLVHNDIHKALLTLTIALGDENLESNSFFVKAKVLGEFHFKTKEDIEAEKALRFYKENGLAILFPYVRSLISDLTSKGNETPVILPTFNIVRLLNEHEKKEKK
ncbi:MULTISPECIES: protein-export chaperone SecB [Bacillus cereus group]|uniref:protein-export chaperone SecB n=1 Tax=Bacillus cereus group TaxID=86661 RepID=UPI0007FB22FF|nr:MULTISPECIES: protein-export chaperone SecB [Bacillus cereus group]MDR4970573.1 protein-export chaperone SecB [Bacillus toyonensis]OBW55701.1 hypothetical protein A9987_26120 [Bacillus cereus]PFD40245.1 hypothetical protein CN278_01815 [Bacillus thuringiensis]PFV77869.1 hypothetical protein COL02_12460 [Bacillus thuringiensis]